MRRLFASETPWRVPVLVALVEDALLDVGPKFLKSIGRHASSEAQRRPHQGVLRIGAARRAPGVGEEVTPENRRVAGTGGPETAVLTAGSKRQPYHIFDASIQGAIRHTKITWILTEYKTASCFNRIPCDDDGLTQSIAVRKTLPVWAVFFRPINSRSEGGYENPAYQIRGAGGVCDEPVETLARCDRVIWCVQRLRFRSRQQRVSSRIFGLVKLR